MTNSRLTDPEILECRFPVRLEDFSIRNGSGGTGQCRGGEGVRRHLRFLEPMTAAILSSHRQIPPFGLAGGSPGQVGRNTVLQKGCQTITSGTTAIRIEAGDSIIIETPGGGGWGRLPHA